tara:strand:- start:38 stop:331 length:294 start_codon:yes stop_codon:yes gene_type:complete
MAWHQDFEGIPLEGKHINYSFLFCVDEEDLDVEKHHVFETLCDKEQTAKRRYGRFIKKFRGKEKTELVSFWRYVWKDGELDDKETNLIYHFRGLHEE